MTDPNKQRITELLESLNDEGLHVVLAGGAARDWYHKRIPKDYDLCDLDAGWVGDHDSYEEAASYAKRVLESYPGVVVTKVHHSYRDGSDTRMFFVIKFTYYDLEFDYLAYTSCPDTPEKQVSQFDTTLNMVWFDHTNGSLKWLNPFFKNVYLGAPVQPLRTLDGDTIKRLTYLQGKYPQYQYSNEVLESLELPL